MRELGLLEAVEFRNVAFESHREALAARGGAGATPALWDGARLHEGLAAVRAALAGSAGPRRTAAVPLAPAPAALLDDAGAPRLGAFRGAIPDADVAPLAGAGLRGALRRLARLKRWIYALAVSDEVLAAVAVVEAGYFAGGFAWAVDRASGALLHEASASGLPRLSASVDVRAAGAARARLATRGLRVEVVRHGARWSVEAEAGEAFSLEALLDASDAPAPFTLVAKVPRGGVRTTHKAAALRAAGRVRAGGRTLSLDGGSGGVDLTAGLLARETSWRWAFATGRVAGAPFGFNLCEGFGVAPAERGENVVFGERTRGLPPVSFAVGGERDPWAIASAGGDVDLVFRPAAGHREARALGFVETRFAQLAGTFEGTIPAPGGGSVAVEGLPGVVEDHWARW